MKLGIFHKVFARPTLEESLDGVQAAGLEAVQLDLTAAGIDPAALTDVDCERIHAAHVTRGIEIAALSGTFNIIDPDLEKRRAGMQWCAGRCERQVGDGTDHFLHGHAQSRLVVGRPSRQQHAGCMGRDGYGHGRSRGERDFGI